MQWRSLITGFCAFLAAPVFAQSLTLGVLPAADSIVLYTASDEGYFHEEGLDVSIIPFKSARGIGAAMREGRLDGYFGDLISVLGQNETGVKQTVVLTTSHTSSFQRSFGLVVSPLKSDTITSMNDLKSTGVAMSSGTIVEYLLDRMKATEKLPANALINQEIRQIPIRAQTLMSGQAYTALLPEPYLTAVQNDGGRVLWDDSKLDEILEVVALKKDLATPKTVSAFRKAVAKAAARIEENPETYRVIMVKRGLLPERASQSYAMVRFSLFGRDRGLPPLPDEDDVKHVGEWMLSQGKLKSVPAWSEVVFPE